MNYTFRMHDPRVGRFFARDPLSFNFPWNSPYAFSENRVMDGRELEGSEVTLIDPKKDATIYNEAVKNTDKSAVHVYMHGSPSSFDLTGNGKWTDKPGEFKAVLEKSDVYKNAKSTEKIVVVLHSCRTGRSFFKENGQYLKAIAQKISAEYPNLILIAPDERGAFIPGKELGPRKITNAKNKRADPVDGEHGKVDINTPGHWNLFEGGEWKGQFDADYNGMSAPSAWDYMFNYTDVDVTITGITTVNNLKVRTTAGYGNNVIKQLPKGSSLNLTGKVDGAWKEISLGGDKKGWVNSSYVEENVSVEVGDKKKE
ncbi:SH3 domain-containing protein [Flavobacterium oreochromis]|nr:SH3 domain-containing protein [Flavobacterium oreochromis]